MEYAMSQEIVDMHSHCLFGVDDGSVSLEMSLAMLEIAYSEGIRTMILTPHRHPTKGKASVETWRKHLDILQQEAINRGIDIKLYLGCEIYYVDETVEQLKKGKAITLADSNYVLLEYSFGADYNRIREGVLDILDLGLTPIVAHVERFDALRGNIKRIEELIDMGAYIQCNADNVSGAMGFKTNLFIKKLLKKHYVDFISTDAHRDDNRQPLIKKTYEYVAKVCDESYARTIMHDNAMKVIQNERIN